VSDAFITEKSQYAEQHPMLLSHAGTSSGFAQKNPGSHDAIESHSVPKPPGWKTGTHMNVLPTA
jgi:hypothetical protein